MKRSRLVLKIREHVEEQACQKRRRELSKNFHKRGQGSWSKSRGEREEEEEEASRLQDPRVIPLLYICILTSDVPPCPIECTMCNVASRLSSGCDYHLRGITSFPGGALHPRELDGHPARYPRASRPFQRYQSALNRCSISNAICHACRNEHTCTIVRVLQS